MAWPTCPTEEGAMRRTDREPPPAGGVAMLWGLFSASILALVVALTPLTHQLDDIKEWIMHVGGGALLALWLWLRRTGSIAEPPPALLWTFGGFLVANVLSTLLQGYPFLFGMADWGHPVGEALLFKRALASTGVEVTWFYFAVGGFVFAGASLASGRLLIEKSMRLWLLTAFATTAFGLFHYGGGMNAVYDAFFARRGDPTRLSSLVYTFARNREMLSTILNPQFFGNFLVMIMPVSASAMIFAALEVGERNRRGESILAPAFWIAAGATGTIMSLMCVYLTFQKSSLYLIPPILVLYMLAVEFGTRFKISRIPGSGLFLACLLATAGVVFSLSRTDFQTKIISLSDSVGPRAIIFGGAWRQFLDYPILGAGPGSFRILFPTYRDPEFHLNRIAHVTAYSHNWILDMLAEVGIVGFGFYAAMLGWIFWAGIRAVRTCPDHALRVAVIGYLVGLLAILAGNLATPMSRWPVGAGSLHAFAGLAAGTIWTALRTPGVPAPSKPWAAPWQSALVAAAVLFALATVPRQNRAWQAGVLQTAGLEQLHDPDDMMRASPRDRDLRARATEAYRRAASGFREALKLDPTRATTYYKLGYTLNRLGEVDAALKAYRELQLYSPDYSEVHYNVGLLCQSAALELAASKDREDQLRAIDYLEESVVEFRRAAKLSRRLYVHRQYARTLLQWARILEGDEGRTLAREAAQAYAAMAEFKLPADKGDRVREELARLDAIQQAPVAFKLAGDTRAALDAYDRLLREQPGDTAAFRGAIETALAAGEKDRARDLIARALELNPLGTDFHLLELRRRAAEDPAEGRRYGAFLLAIASRERAFLSRRERDILTSYQSGEGDLSGLAADPADESTS